MMELKAEIDKFEKAVVEIETHRLRDHRTAEYNAMITMNRLLRKLSPDAHKEVQRRQNAATEEATGKKTGSPIIAKH